jgi:hypothetical protein
MSEETNMHFHGDGGGTYPVVKPLKQSSPILQIQDWQESTIICRYDLETDSATYWDGDQQITADFQKPE